MIPVSVILSKKCRVSGLVWLWLVLSLSFGAQSLAAEVQVIRLQHRPASEVLPLVEPLLEKGESVVGKESVLIVKAAPERISQLEDIVKVFDTPRIMLKVGVRQENGQVVDGSGVGFSSSGGERTDVQASRHLGNMRHSTENFVRVLDGEGAFISVGKEVPFTKELSVVAGRYNAVARSVEYKSVTTGFWVRPQVVGEKVYLDIAPQLMALGPKGEETIEFQKLHTQIVLDPGQWVDLAGQMNQADEVSAAIFRLNANAAENQGTIWVRVDR